MDCKMQWLQHDHPRLNFKKFSKDEMNRLVELVEVLGMDDWGEIAKELGVSLVPFCHSLSARGLIQD